MSWLLLMFFIPGGFDQVEGLATKQPFHFPFDEFHGSVTYLEEPPVQQNQHKLRTKRDPTGIQFSFGKQIPGNAFGVSNLFDQVSGSLTGSVPFIQSNIGVSQEVSQNPRTGYYLENPKLDYPEITSRRENPKTGYYVENPKPNYPEITSRRENPKTGYYLENPKLDYPEITSRRENPKTGYYGENPKPNYSEITSRRENPKTGYFGETPEISSRQKSLDKSCGRRKVVHTELIVNGQSTKSGDWPWHVAISKITKLYPEYICGGTLLSKTVVLTAAHCAALRGNAVIADSIIVYLGKYYRIKGDATVQEREVFEIIIHPEYNPTTLNNDIALLKLKSEAVFTDYVQPACLRNPDIELPTKDVFGTVVGWGLNNLDELSPTLQRTTIPIVSELDCLKSNTIFFHQKLNTYKFCAGYANGTSACNGDSGGGLMIFVPDTPGDTNQAAGSWYVRGIVSLSPSKFETNFCDPQEYTIFTDVEKYRDWLSEYLI